MEIQTSPLPIPDALNKLPRTVIPPHGPLVGNTDVALVFGVTTSSIRKWRQIGRFPAPCHRESNQTYYKIADLLPWYYKRFPGELPDPELDAMISGFVPFSERVGETGGGGNGAEYSGAGSGKAVLTMTPEQARADLVALVTEAVAKLVEREPESHRVIEIQADAIAAQRREIEALKREIEAVKIELERESRWRELPLMQRVSGGGKRS
jgi:hypothetical protein